MKIDINQKKISIGDKYDIFVEDNQTYKAKTELFKLLSVIDLFENDADRPKMTIRKRWSWWGAKYDLERHDGNVFRFQTLSVRKIQYRCQVGFDRYDIYGHRGRKHSIFKNGVQIGWWDKAAVTWFDGDNYSITADDDADIELLMSFCLLMDNYASKDKDKGAVSVDFGNLGFGCKKFDSNWRPKYQ